MSAILFRFEAIESRITSATYPRATSGRVHSHRRPRYSRQNIRQYSIASEGQQLYDGQQNARQRTEFQKTVPSENFTLRASSQEIDSRDRTTPVPLLNESTTSLGRPLRGRSVSADIWAGRTGRTGIHILKAQGSGDVVNLSNDSEASALELAEKHTVLSSALRLGNPQAVLHALGNYAKSNGFDEFAESYLAKIPATTFSEILRCLDPKHFVYRYMDLYREANLKKLKLLGLSQPNSSGYHKFCSVFLSSVSRIMNLRQRHSPLQLSDYKYLLQCARAVGNKNAAQSIWDMMKNAHKGVGTRNRELAPDAECYNHYLAAKCLSDHCNVAQNYRLRIIPNNLEPRSWPVPPRPLAGHKIGIGGIKAQVSHLFKEMVQNGVPGNEETFSLMIIALAREGDMLSIRSILKRIWDIDVEALLATTDEADVQLPKQYSHDSPFHPSTNLLYAIAHSFGINNAIPMALRLIDYISRQYSVEISEVVWNELLNWTFVLSLRRTQVQKEKGEDAGQLPAEAVSNIWSTMVSEPYNVQPTMQMYNRLIVNLIKRERYGEVQVRMQEARNLHERSVRELMRKALVFHRSKRQNGGRDLISQQYERDLLFNNLRYRMNKTYFRRWLRLLIHYGSKALCRPGNPVSSVEWPNRRLPDLLLKWSPFLPRTIEYVLPSGSIKFASGTQNIARKIAQRRRKQIKHRLDENENDLPP